ncbi:hypothetical protein D9613_010124 [Agrocybe pediades]|uniref:AB hydrolase-1 domain-containing protein n=1 Tax=Agrocybe pediades TaxID=84607 RepID=A0A8H4QWV2_9AGAR|nr:hypothetical protein D9613_010124 [Agrocybe pediades]
MPQVKITSSSGPAVINYTISTPNAENAQSIDPTLPIILFLHPVYIGHVIFHNQFSDINLRRFNLIGFDSRGHGTTTGAIPSTYRRIDAAEDVFRFMEALRLPPCHLVGMSLGACVALQTAISYPEKVLSLFMLSPLPLIEPEIVAEGRQEIYDCWVEGRKESNKEALLDAVFGALQLGFNGHQDPLVNALIQSTMPKAMVNWSPEHFEEYHTISVKFFTDRKPHPLHVLQGIKCPIQILQCGQDIAYPVEFAEELRDRLSEAGVDVRLTQVVDAPHFGCVTNPEEINENLYEWVLENQKGYIPPAKGTVVSPFQSELAKYGLDESDSNKSDSDEDDLMVV